MTNLDLAAFLIAGIAGSVLSYHREDPRWGQPVAWAIVGIWALLKLLKVLA